MRKTFFLSLFTSKVFLMGCGEKPQNTEQIVVKNTLDNDRAFETVTLYREILGELFNGNIGIRDVGTKELISQTVDSDGDGVVDALLFQPEVAANSEKIFELVQSQNTLTEDVIRTSCPNVPTIMLGKTTVSHFEPTAPRHKKWSKIKLREEHFRVE